MKSFFVNLMASWKFLVLPALAKLATKARADYGDAYCGGKIGASMKRVLNA